MNKVFEQEQNTTMVRLHHQELKNHDRKSHRTIVILSTDSQHFVGIAKCDKRDQFAKKKGRLIAYGRACAARIYEAGEWPGPREYTRPDLMFCAMVDPKFPHIRRLSTEFDQFEKKEVYEKEYSPEEVLRRLPDFLFAAVEREKEPVAARFDLSGEKQEAI